MNENQAGIYVGLPTGVVGEGKRQRTLHSYVSPWDVVCIEETASADGVPKAKVFLSKGAGQNHWVIVIGLKPEEIAERLHQCWAAHVAEKFLAQNQARGLDGVLGEIVRLGKADLLQEGRRMMEEELPQRVVSYLEKMGDGAEDSLPQSKGKVKKAAIS